MNGEVHFTGGPLAVASTSVDEPRPPVVQELIVGSVGASLAKAPPCRSLNGQMLEEAFAKWILQQSEDKQKAIMRNYDSMKAQEEQWLANIGVQEAANTGTPSSQEESCHEFAGQVAVGQCLPHMARCSRGHEPLTVKGCEGTFERGSSQLCVYPLGPHQRRRSQQVPRIEDSTRFQSMMVSRSWACGSRAFDMVGQLRARALRGARACANSCQTGRTDTVF